MIAAFFHFGALVLLLIILTILSFGICIYMRYHRTKKFLLGEMAIFFVIGILGYFYFYNHAFRSTISPEKYFAWHDIETKIPLPPNSISLFSPTGRGWVYYSKTNVQESQEFFMRLQDNPNIKNFKFDQETNVYYVTDVKWKAEIKIYGDEDDRRFYVGMIPTNGLDESE